MKNTMRCLGIIALVAVIGASFAACDNGTGGGNGGGGGGGGGSGLNGTWVNSKGSVLVLNNGSFTQKDNNNVDIARGTYTTSGNRFTLTITQVNGAMYDGLMGLSPNQWYNEQQYRNAVIDYMVSKGMTRELAEQSMNKAISDMFGPQNATYTLSGNTLTLDWEVDVDYFHSSGIDIYTRNGTGGGTDPGGGTNPGGGGNNWPPSSTLAEFGLSGLTPIPGATNAAYFTNTAAGQTSLGIIFDGSSTTDNYVINWFTNNGWTEFMKMDGSDSIICMYRKTGFQAIYSRDKSDNDCTISVSKGNY